jgi:3-methyladenine DNA glycosylase AlkD
MDLAETMKTLEALGTEQTRKTYTRHGAAEPLFGVLFGELAKLQKRIGKDHDLAAALWNTGNHDARLLACMVADPARTSRKELAAWAAGTKDSGTEDALAGFAARTPFAGALGEEWRNSSKMARAGWSLLAYELRSGSTIAEPAALAAVAHIEKRIHAAENWTRRGMMFTLIALGATTPALRKAVEAAVRRIGPVAFDPGDTACGFPDALPYIAKMWARKAAKGDPRPRTATTAKKAPERQSRAGKAPRN